MQVDDLVCHYRHGLRYESDSVIVHRVYVSFYFGIHTLCSRNEWCVVFVYVVKMVVKGISYCISCQSLHRCEKKFHVIVNLLIYDLYIELHAGMQR